MKTYLIILTALVTYVTLSCSSADTQTDAAHIPPADKDIVVLLHGLGRSKTAMWLLASRLEDAGFHVERIGYKSLNKTSDEILTNVSLQIDKCCAHYEQTVHFVGHSLGGLLVRAYLQDNQVDHLGRVVLMGTPNQGTEVVDRFRDKWWMRMLGPMALSLGTDSHSFPASLDAPDYPVGVIAGVAGNGANDRVLPGEDDGLVTIEATRLPGMSDFTIVESGHSFMRYDDEVAKQTVSFLKDGKFIRDKNPLE